MTPSTSYIPRFLLPQYGTIWRSSTARAMPFARPISADVGQVLVRYASNTAAAKSTATTTATAAKKVAAPKAASTKAAATKTTKAPAAKTTPPKTAPTKPTLTKAAAPKAATRKTPTSASSIKNAPVTSASKPVAPEPVAKAPPAAATRKPATANPSKPIHYGGALGAEELTAQKTKEYPGLPPPPNTWSHWFIHNKHIHMFITLGALMSLGAYTFTARFNANSPFADMIPPIGEFPKQPINYIRTCVEVLKLHEEHESAQTADKRRRRIEDVQKRNEYRKAHGLPIANGIESWTGTGKAAKPAEEEGAVVAAIPASAAPSAVLDATSTSEQTEADGKRKKFLGIF
ncbi:hypothetical protein PG988_005780 [Apiospora saccharicola]